MSLPTIDTSNPAVEAFLKNAHRHTFKNREVIVRPGDPADTLYYIIEGSVTVSLENEDGNDLILDYLNAAGESLFCESLFWASKPKQTAKLNATVYAFGAPTVLRTLRNHLFAALHNSLSDSTPT
ncbi:cyclic nucleotide-binding domain-containing protein [Candidatus Reidiella endopervernicosa]|uniref:Cyclic nucleotide-binding domain-containing protein n=1 Tax=Candidatus Reidiella endopervernicosa TaxID=2738883 RepID=A0A6N0HXH3_9GAMM|nr:cyclic nucleotide-binding domain-containing protein [Candidatus Reidiella endopervernicosa]QKQ27070.1 cyclic nucleotide-binding domain-containing protein [Candidatus Reidiella endopervernicosa]